MNIRAGKDFNSTELPADFSSEISQLRNRFSPSPPSVYEAIPQLVRASTFVARTGLPKESKARQVPHYGGNVLRGRGTGGRSVMIVVSAARTRTDR